MNAQEYRPSAKTRKKGYAELKIKKGLAQCQLCRY